MQKIFDIKHVAVTNDTLVLVIGEQEYKFPLKEVSKKLQDASEVERKDFKVSPSGYGIHWRLLDEDISIPALLKDLKS